MNDHTAASSDTAAEPSATDAADAAAASNWPLFYRRPELLSQGRHQHWRIRPSGVSFAARANSVPVVIGEFAAASRCYPLVFAGPEHMPVAVLGLAENNRFVDGEAWCEGAYLPAYVRRYPFAFAEVPGQDRFALALDAEAPMVVREGEEGQALFENGEPTELTQRALRFCEAFTRENRATRQFVEALRTQDLLVERHATVTRTDGQRTSLDGFAVISPDALAHLPEAVIVDWHRSGWLALVHAHLASLACFADLLAE